MNEIGSLESMVKGVVDSEYNVYVAVSASRPEFGVPKKVEAEISVPLTLPNSAIPRGSIQQQNYFKRLVRDSIDSEYHK